MYIFVIKAVWGAQELLKYSSSLQKTMKVPLEYQPSTLEFLCCLMTGLAYLCIYNILLETAQGTVGDENLASLEREVSNCFYTVKDVLKNNSTLRKLFKELNEDVISKYYEFGINCLIRTANVFEKKHAEAKAKGYIGIQYAYLHEVEVLLKNMDNESFKDKKDLQKKFQPIIKKAEETKILIDQVFQCKIPKREELNDIKPIEQRVRPLEPKNIRIPPKDAEFFAGFVSEEMEATRSSLTLFITNKRQHVEKSLYDLREKMQQLNQTYNIPFLKNSGNLSQTLINDDFKKKLLFIRENGDKKFLGLLNQDQTARGQLEKSFADIDDLVNKELEKDKQALAYCQQGNYTTFVQSFAEQLDTINNLKQGFRAYKAIDEKINNSHKW